MPKTCCVPGCDVGQRTCAVKASLFRLPSDPVERELWKKAIPRAETERFKFDSPNTRVCALHFDPTDIVRTDDFIINEEVVRQDRVVPMLRSGAVPRVFPNCPSYLSSPKPRSRVRTTRSTTPKTGGQKLAQKRKQTTCPSPSDKGCSGSQLPTKKARSDAKENTDPAPNAPEADGEIGGCEIGETDVEGKQPNTRKRWCTDSDFSVCSFRDTCHLTKLMYLCNMWMMITESCPQSCAGQTRSLVRMRKKILHFPQALLCTAKTRRGARRKKLSV